jgi:hypothetical protein
MVADIIKIDACFVKSSYIQMLPATLKDDRTTLTQWTEIQTDKYLDSIVQTTGRPLMPTASCFNFFPTAQKNLKFYASPHWHICLCPPTAQANAGAKSKEPILPSRTNWWFSKIEPNKQHDLENFIKLKSEGWNVLTIFECQLKSKNINETLIKTVKKLTGIRAKLWAN